MLSICLAIPLLLGSAPLLGRGPVDLVVTSPDAPLQSAQTPFRATQIIDLEFSAAFRARLRGPHLLEFKVYTPNGKLYQALVAPFTGDVPRREGRRVDGFPEPLPEQTMQESTGRWRPFFRPGLFHVTARLPVAGTWIITNSLYGQWRVDLYLDRAEARIGTANFSMAP
jgi:hypothetical protein